VDGGASANFHLNTRIFAAISLIVERLAKMGAVIKAIAAFNGVCKYRQTSAKSESSQTGNGIFAPGRSHDIILSRCVPSNSDQSPAHSELPTEDEDN